MLRCLFLITPLLAVACLLCGTTAFAGKLSGSAELRYAQHTAEEEGVEVLDASHFTQQYSLMWETAGEFNRGRLGVYDVALGYEWNWVDSEINGIDVPFDNPIDKVLFRGDVLLAPGGLPFRMNLYSYDTDSVGLSYRQLGQLFLNQDYDHQDGIVVSLNNSTHITTGFTLLVGEQNGQYRGAYRDLFTAMPRILVDFMQVDVKDTSGPLQRNYTDRNLAFVSLNKNKNWFHYKYFIHDDKEGVVNDFEQKMFLLGTIDHVDRRQWIDLTNWIKVSSDISYSETTPGSDVGVRQERYDINLFSTAEKSNWRVGSYANFRRVRGKRSLEKILDVPVFASGVLNRDTSWRFRAEGLVQENDTFEVGKWQSNNLFFEGRLETLKQSRYLLSPSFGAEHVESTRGDGYALRMGLEAYNNPRYRSAVGVFGSYSAAVYEGDLDSGEDFSYLEQRVVGKLDKDLNSDLRAGIEQSFDLGTGSYDGILFNHLLAGVEAVTNVQEGSGVSGVPDGDYFRSLTVMYADHRPANRINNRLELSHDYIDSAVGTDSRFAALHSLNYYGRTLTASISNELIWNGELFDRFNTDQGLVGDTVVSDKSGFVSTSFESIARFSYDPDRVHHNDLRLELEWREFHNGGTDERYRIEQIYEYTFWKDSGLIRRMAVLGEEFEYENYSSNFLSGSRANFTLFSELYPTRQTLLSARLRYEVDSVEDTDTALVFLSASVDFSKFQMEFDYAYGTRTEGELVPERVEHKWEVKVKKIF